MANVDIVHSVYTQLENRPGSLERVAKVLAEKRINIDAISLETQGTQGFARLLTHKPKEAVEALRNANLAAYESNLVVMALPNKSGELARACSELSAAGLNIEGIVTTTDGRLGFRTNDVEMAATILRKL